MRRRLNTHLAHRLDREGSLLAERQRRSSSIIRNLIEHSRRDIAHLSARVRALSPAATLDRGYAIVTGTGGVIIRDEAQVAIGDEIRVRVASGEFTSTRIANRATEQGSSA